MADRVYPASKPTVNGGSAAVTTAAPPANLPYPPTKAQLYNATRPAYRPQPRRTRRRSCCCSCFLWTTLIIIIILLLAAVSGAVLWFLYRPHRPNFSVSSFNVAQFNLTSSSQLTSKFNLTVSARNPNKKLEFLYDPVAISIFTGDVDIGDGSFPAFVHGTKNTTTLKASISSADQKLESGSAAVLRADLKNKQALPLKIRLDTKVKVKIGGMKTKKVGIRVTCDGIKATIPSGKSGTTAVTSGAKCKVDGRIKIWKWTV